MPTARFNYQTDNGSIFYVRDDSDDVLQAIRGAIPTGTVTENITLRKTKNTKQAGLRPRYALFARQVGTAGTNANGLATFGKRYKKVVLLTQAAANAIVVGNIDGAGVTSFTQRGAIYWAQRVVGEDRD